MQSLYGNVDTVFVCNINDDSSEECKTDTSIHSPVIKQTPPIKQDTSIHSPVIKQTPPSKQDTSIQSQASKPINKDRFKLDFNLMKSFEKSKIRKKLGSKLADELMSTFNSVVTSFHLEYNMSLMIDIQEVEVLTDQPWRSIRNVLIRFLYFETCSLRFPHLPVIKELESTIRNTFMKSYNVFNIEGALDLFKIQVNRLKSKSLAMVDGFLLLLKKYGLYYANWLVTYSMLKNYDQDFYVTRTRVMQLDELENYSEDEREVLEIINAFPPRMKKLISLLMQDKIVFTDYSLFEYIFKDEKETSLCDVIYHALDCYGPTSEVFADIKEIIIRQDQNDFNDLLNRLEKVYAKSTADGTKNAFTIECEKLIVDMKTHAESKTEETKETKKTVPVIPQNSTNYYFANPVVEQIK